jgi:thioredoxin 1
MKKILKFSAAWCAPCKMVSQALSTFESPIEIEEIDIDSNPSLAKEYQIRGIPTLVMLEDGVEIKRNVGLIGPDKLKNWINT